MARDNRIPLDDDEKQDLDSVRQEMFGTDQVPYGVVIQQLINHWRDTDCQQ